MVEYITNFVGPNLQSKLIKEIDQHEWNLKLSRRTQHYIHEYDYKSRNALAEAAPMPKYIKLVADHLISQNVIESIDQVIVNEYKRNQGISAHTDKNIFGPIIAIISLGSYAEMIFRKEGETPIVQPLEPGSLLIISGEMRDEWTHEITSNVGGRAKDFRRLSITYRSIV